MGGSTLTGSDAVNGLQQRLLEQLKPLVTLVILSTALTLLTWPLATRLDPESGSRLCGLAGLTCFMAGVAVLSLPVLFPVAETYLMVVAVGFGVRMFFPLLACGVLMKMVGVDETRVFAICLLIISPILLFWETWSWTRNLSHLSDSKKNK